MEHIWIFNGVDARFPGGAFSSKENAEAWITENGLSGLLVKYPVDVGLYDWAVDSGIFNPKRNEQKTARFIQRFGCASAEHYHYEDGLES